MPHYRTKLRPKSKKKRNLLPLWLSLAGLGLVLVAVWGIMASNAQARANIEVKGSPRLKVEKDFIDHGIVKWGTVIRDVVTVTNIGDQPLRFTEAPYVEVKEGCCPPTPAVSSMVIKPGESTRISMEYMMHDEMGGNHDFRLQLKTNDPTQPVQEVQILSNWVP